jgi:hypothetical protein
MKNDDVFLNKISQKIRSGDYNEYLTLPFMTKDLLLVSIRERINKKLLTKTTPILSDNEIKDCIDEVKETAVNIMAVYLRMGFIEKTEEGLTFTHTGNIAIKAAYLFKNK